MHTRALIEREGRIFNRSYSAWKRQKPTRMPYSCQLQFATSGKVVTPVGGARTCLGMGREISHTSTFTIVQTIIRSPFGRLSFGRSMIAEYFERSRGKVIRGFTFRFQDCGQLLPLVVSSRAILGIASRSFILTN